MNKFKSFIPFILIGAVVLFSLGKTLQYYFYTDDFAFLYYLQNNFNFGWPYNSVLPLFRPIYMLFGTNSLLYFSLALFTYFLASITVYFFVVKLTSNRLIAFLSSLIFATGYIGIDQFTMIAVSIINNLNIINVCITLIFLIYWINTKKFKYYALTLLMFFLSVKLFPYRAYPLVLFLPTLEFIETFRIQSVKKMIKWSTLFITRYIPFILVAFYLGVFSYGSNGSGGEPNLYLTYHSRLFNLLNFDFFKELFAVFGRFVLVRSISDLFSFVPDQNFFAFIGFISFFTILLISLTLFLEGYLSYVRSLIAVLVLTIEAYIGNMILNVDFDSGGPTNRYLTISFLFFSVIFPLLLFLILEKRAIFKKLERKRVLIFFGILIIFLFSSLSREYEDSIILNRSLPAKSFLKQIKTYIPKLFNSSYSVFYFDHALYAPVSARFQNVLLSAALDKNVNLAVPYKISTNSAKIVNTFDDFLRLVNNPPLDKKTSYYTFYDDQEGLHSTTDKVFALLKNGNIQVIPESKIQYELNKNSSSVIIKTDGVSSLTPIRVKFNLTASPLNSSLFTFPYIGVSNQQEIDSAKDYYEKNNIQKNKIFEYLLSREKYYKTVKIDVESIHIAKQNLASYLVDDNPDTFWLSDQSRWEVNIKPWIKIDLGQELSISKLLWRQLPNRVITGFTIETSNDGINWIKVNNIRQNNLTTDSNLIINSFSPIDARYIRLTINRLLGPGPGLAEIEAVENEFKDVDLSEALRVKDNLFEYIKNEAELTQTYLYLSQNAKIKIIVKTDRDDPNVDTILEELPISLDGQSHEYEFQIPQGGTELKDIELSSNFPASFSIKNVILENLSGDILRQQIEQKCQEFAKEKVYANPFICQ